VLKVNQSVSDSYIEIHGALIGYSGLGIVLLVEIGIKLNSLHWEGN